MRKRTRKVSSLVTEGSGSFDTTPVQSARERGGDSCGIANMEVMVHRSSVAPHVSCLLCGGFLRDATTIPDCLHSFCRECIVEKFRIEDINCCPKCDIDLGCSPLQKLRADHSLQAIRSVIFPAERQKVEDIAPLHPEQLALPRSSPQAYEVDRLETEPPASLAKPIASRPHTAVAPATGPTLLVPSASSGNRQGDAQREHTPLALREGGRSVEEYRGAIEGMGVEVCTPISELAVLSEELKCEHRSLIDKQDTAQARNTLTNEVDTLICATDDRKTKKATGSTLSIVLEATVQKTFSLLPAASQSEAREEVENTARVLGRAETYSGRSQGLEADIARIRHFRESEKKKAEEAAFERTRISEELLQRKSKTAQSNMGIFKRIDAYIGRSQAFEAETARLRGEHENERARNLEELQGQSEETAKLREELEYERAEKAAAFERVRVLEEKLRTESEVARKAVASHRLLFQEHQALELQSYEKIDRLNRSLAEARMSAAKQKLNAAEARISVVEQKWMSVAEQKLNASEARISVVEQKCDARVRDEMTAKIVEERDQLKSELKNVMKRLARAEAFARTINDILARHIFGSLKSMAERMAELGMKFKIDDPSTEMQEMARLLSEEMARNGIKIDPSSIFEDFSVLTEPPFRAFFLGGPTWLRGHGEGAL